MSVFGFYPTADRHPKQFCFAVTIYIVNFWHRNVQKPLNIRIKCVGIDKKRRKMKKILSFPV